tara:strand:- start:7260 stop:7451 length:192 start_codon:yes stop_codon:yes gene_type:complete
MISKEKIEARLAKLPPKSGHAKVLRKRLNQYYPETPVVEEVVVEEAVVEEKHKKRSYRKKKES